MATSKLYPTLSKFYENRFIGFGSELDNLHSDNKSNRKDPASSKVNEQNNTQKVHTGNNSNAEKPLYPLLNKNCSRDLQHAHGKSHDQPLVPSAPPVELSDEDLLRFLEYANREDIASASLDDTPVADYSDWSLHPGVSLNNTWVDDVKPDYDVTIDSLDIGYLNNLDKADAKAARDKSVSIRTRAELSIDLNIDPDNEKVDLSKKEQLRNSGKRHEITVSVAEQRHDQSTDTKFTGQGKENTKTAADRPKRPSPGSPEYNAWMTWRKQVNRQLASLILIKHGGQVKLQTQDMSRKHLSRRSIDFVSNVVKSGNKTSLGGKPFVMYGIPRASLSGSQRELNTDS